MTVIVIGAGIVGVSIADALARGGAAPIVLDRRSPGLGATVASAGILAPYIEGYGHEAIARLGARSLGLFDDFVSRLAEDSGLPLEYARTGTLEVAFDDADRTRLRAKEQWMAAAGAQAVWLDQRDARTFEPAIAPEVIGALLTPCHGFVGARGLVRALVSRAKFAGAVFESPIDVTAVEARGDSVEVRAGERRYAADAVVIATGSWSGRIRLVNLPALPVRPVRGQLLHLRWRGAGAPRQVVWGPRCYTVSWADGSLLVGATVENAGFDESATTAGLLSLSSAVSELFPGASQASLDGVRVGLRPALPDDLPAIGPYASAPRIVVATGHFRNGVLLSPLTAEVVSEYVLRGRQDEIFGVTSPDRAMTPDR